MADAYVPAPDRYDRMTYRRCGRSGLDLPLLSLGFWWNFGDDRPLETQRAVVRRPSTSASRTSTWPTTTARRTARPSSTSAASCARTSAAARRARHQHQGRLGHVEGAVRRPRLAQVPAGQPRPEPAAARAGPRRRLLPPPARPATPLEESMGALHTAVQQGKALYVGISSYGDQRTAEAVRILRELGTPLLIHQPSYSMLNRWIETRCSTCSTGGRRLHRLHRAGAGLLTGQVPRRRPGGQPDGPLLLAGPGAAHGGERRAPARAERHRPPRGRRWRRWRWPGRCATSG
jgi:L-glyceraldehyde 3-phosphate reductase